MGNNHYSRHSLVGFNAVQRLLDFRLKDAKTNPHQHNNINTTISQFTSILRPDSLRDLVFLAKLKHSFVFWTFV